MQIYSKEFYNLYFKKNIYIYNYNIYTQKEEKNVFLFHFFLEKKK